MSTTDFLVSDSSGPKLNKSLLCSDHIWINCAIQSEASIVLLILLISQVLSRKRCSAIFLLHMLILILIIARNILRCFQFLETHDNLRPNRSRANTWNHTLWITTNMIAFLILLCIEASLYIHAHAACITLRKLHRQFLFGVSASVTVLAIGFRLAFYVEDLRNAAPSRSFSFDWLLRVSNLMTSMYICWLCIIVSVKLGLSLHFRSNHGSGRFGPIQFIVIMCCQTFVTLGLF